MTSPWKGESMKPLSAMEAGVPRFDDTPCGQRAVWDAASGMGYICQYCLCVVGSVGSPCWKPEPK